MTKNLSSKLALAASLMCAYKLPQAAPAEFVYEYAGEKFPYTVSESGENHTFEFSRNPGREPGRLNAAQHVFKTVYGDDTIAPKYSEFFMKETARCFAFDGRFYTYRVCILPNDYSPDKQDRFWGFVNRLPNTGWFLTYNALPAGLVGIALYYFVFREKRPAA
ncbi:hypothetical protein [Methylococcus sp. EFPC2]|uniref:hypothetical protein n=1 Tax=Methylococcus sp. EFPC2 TaxID=2812648 RepID=UPI001967423D|nr:hypothetical protein [Methylococcus sp. EFPC2]QSA97209.1 hypothetical protein JWZ97_18805 [Methylococcus sp. EFPC2]